MIKRRVVLLFSISVLVACRKSNTTANIDCSVSKSFSSDVLPVIQSSCSYSSSCHASGSTHGPGALLSYSQIYSNRSTIRSAVVSGSMPENSSLSAADLNAIVCWIDAGAVDN